MTYSNQYVYVDCRPEEPEIYFKDKTDVYNETSGYTTKKRGVKNFIKFLDQIFKDERLKDDLKFQDITKLLQKANLPYRTYCAMD